MEQSKLAARQDAIIHNPLLRAFFGPRGFYNAGYYDRHVQTQEQACVHLMERLASRMSPVSGRILDVGCGLGATTAELRRLFPNARVIGANLSHDQTVESAYNAASAFVQMDGARLALRTASMSAVASIEAVLFFQTRGDFLLEAARVLTPAGQLTITDLLFSNAKWANDWHVPKENHITRIAQYRDLLLDTGFTDIRIEDSTDHSWKRMWDSFCRWLDQQQHQGRVNATEAKRWTLLAERFRDEAILHYILVWARRHQK